MALEHTQGFEVACNLLDPSTPPALVLATCEELLAARGLRVLRSYRTGPTLAEALAAFNTSSAVG